VIKHEGNKWVLYAKDGEKVLGSFDTEDEAKERERQIIAAKAAKGELQTEDIEGVSILAPGTWIASDGKPTKITLQDMEQAVENWHALQDRVRPVFKMQHLDPETHKKVTSLFAFGWLQNPRIEREQVKVDIKKVPAKVAQLIRAGSLRDISAEIYTKAKPWYDAVSKKFVPNVITAAGALGSDAPAVKTLDDMVALFKDGAECPLDSLPEYDADVVGVPTTLVEREAVREDVVELTQADIDLAVKKAKEETEKAERTKFAEALGADGDPLAAAKDLVKDRDDSQAKLAEADQKAFDAETDAILHQAKVDKKILPAHEDKYRKVCSAFAASDRATAHEQLKEMLSELPALDIPGSGGEKGTEVNDDRVRVGGDIDPTPGDVAHFSEANGVEINAESYEIAQKIAECQRREHTDYDTAFCEVTGATPMEYLQPLDPRRIRGDR
jgi:hypothetical protein